MKAGWLIASAAPALMCSMPQVTLTLLRLRVKDSRTFLHIRVTDAASNEIDLCMILAINSLLVRRANRSYPLFDSSVYR